MGPVRKERKFTLSFWRHRAGRREAEERASLRERELRSIEAISAALSHADDAESVARVLLDEIAALFSVEFAGLALVDDERNEANGLLARRDGKDFAFWRGLRFDLPPRSRPGRERGLRRRAGDVSSTPATRR